MLDASPTSMGTPPGDAEDHARPSLSPRGLGDCQGRIHAAWTTTRRYLAEQLGPDGFWAGALSTSALSTATAVSAMVQYRRAVRKDDGSQQSFPSSESTLRQLQDLHPAIDAGCQWLLKHQNADGGFGDTDKSHSNVATTFLVLAAWKMADTADSASLRCSSDSMAIEELEIVPKASDYFAASQRAKAYLKQQGGWDALRARYGRDKTFVVPILSNCALAGMVPWQRVPALPFEAAWLPQEWYRWARMPVVSYAVPALVAIGQARFQFSPPRNPLLRLLRRQAQQPTLAVLERMQPASGGYLEATPLTSFVMMNLSAMGHVRHAVVQNSLRFILDSRLADGSWPIDTNLATWLTSLSLSAEASAAGRLSVTLHDAPSGNMKLERGQELSEQELSEQEFSEEEPQWTQLASSLEKPPTSELTVQVSPRTIRWLLDCQHRNRHPFTGANPGGWGWTNLSGAVPDADDTPAALLALAKLDLSTPELDRLAKQTLVAAHSGLHWLLRLQNRDGGWPTFCRGWGKLPFDRSGTDLTAHALRAFQVWLPRMSELNRAASESSSSRRLTGRSIERAMRRGLRYLKKNQQTDGSWLPLWFGNQDRSEEDNPVYGTAKVLLAYADLELGECPEALLGTSYLRDHQNPDGGWGGGISPSYRVYGDATSSDTNGFMPPNRQDCGSSIEETALALEALLRCAGERGNKATIMRGLNWLAGAVEQGHLATPWPIGFYFAKLWYYERLYPAIFTLGALGTALRQLSCSVALRDELST